ncbi:MAG: hypothetical protein LRZ85_00200 [Alphaproteobacteria bacterium]|nr:hypothetical protein [Alphaproteobacteria bacterium]MCD8520366.1 hypothetical protein [Alphaproteobacteria bacterium]MCD8526055.1 hypothetical protein [Alphaproteobacteria bacterium]MCD8571604.1 hypothetical protein [Alphaproteobacteria bacterium]
MKFVKSCRVAVFVPSDSAEGFIAAVSGKLPVLFGNYDHVCWWSEPGTEQFRPLSGAHPVEGEIGKTERVRSIRVEFSLPGERETVEQFVRDVVMPAHPWEQPVIMIYEAEIAQI